MGLHTLKSYENLMLLIYCEAVTPRSTSENLLFLQQASVDGMHERRWRNKNEYFFYCYKNLTLYFAPLMILL